MATKIYSLPYTGAKIKTAIEYALNGSNELQGKQDKLTFDSSPTEGSSNPVTSDGVFQEFEQLSDKLTETESIAKGCQQAISFANYESMWNEISNMDAHKYNIGQNIMIVTLDVPDLWVSGISDTPSPIGFFSDEYVVGRLKEVGVIEVGYYRLSPLETQKVNLTDYATHKDLQDSVNDVMTEIIFRGIITEDELYEKIAELNLQNSGDVVFLYKGANKTCNQPHPLSPYYIFSTEVNAEEGYFVAPIQNMRIFKIGDVLNVLDPSEETTYPLTITDMIYGEESVSVYCAEELPYSTIDLAYANSQLTFDVSDGDLLLASQVNTGTWVYLNLNDGRNSGGNVTVDSELSETSINPVQNKTITQALDNKQDKLTFDYAPTFGSSNPVTSEGIYAYFREEIASYYNADQVDTAISNAIGDVNTALENIIAKYGLGGDEV